MKRAVGLISLAVMLLAMSLPPTAAAQMMQDGMMGGGRHGMITLVSPADSPTQIRRGSVMIGEYMLGIMGRDGYAVSRAPSMRIVLRLSGVANTKGLVTDVGNHLILEGQLTTPTGNRAPISIDQLFALNAGSALVMAAVNLPSNTGPATITIDRIAVQDQDHDAFAVPGIALAQPTPQTTPRPTPSGHCKNDNDCNDGNPSTQDTCTLMGCRHMPDHMGGPMM